VVGAHDPKAAPRREEVKRREFLSSALAATGAGLALRSAAARDTRLEVLVNEPVGEISPEIYGHFIEHLGGVIYDGIWVGEDSKVANIGGLRKSLVDRMRKLRAPVVRWPGGCFADSYDWRDGVGPRTQRPVRTNFWCVDSQLWKAPAGPQKFEPNIFGTAEFMRFCQACGAFPYLAANVRSLTPLDFDHWVEYCNSPAGSTTLAKIRAGDGSSEPYGVTRWGIGNESWGCGGDFKPQEYATEFRRFTAWVPNYGLSLRLIASGPGASSSDPQVEWTQGVLEGLASKSKGVLERVYGLSLHYYCSTTGKGKSDSFTQNDWYQLLWQANIMESLITQHWDAMVPYDPGHKVKLVVDEWGAWHHGDPIDPRYLFSYAPSLRDAVVTALTLDTFNRHAEKLALCAVAQLVNCINSLFLAKEDQFTVTPVFHVFDLYKSHMGGQALRVVGDAPPIVFQPKRTLPGLASSASVHEKKLVITAVNPHIKEPRGTEVILRGASAVSCQATVLTATDIQAHNDFEHPNAVEPRTYSMEASGSNFIFEFPPASVVKLEIALA
jgi:alpha-L-arabinofuranosidase